MSKQDVEFHGPLIVSDASHNSVAYSLFSVEHSGSSYKLLKDREKLERSPIFFLLSYQNINLLALELFFLILAHPVYKM